jgi:hypothetical protein
MTAVCREQQNNTEKNCTITIEEVKSKLAGLFSEKT